MHYAKYNLGRKRMLGRKGSNEDDKAMYKIV